MGSLLVRVFDLGIYSMHGARFDTEWSLGQPQRPEAGSGTLSPARPARSKSGLVERCDGKGALISGRNSDLRHFPLIEGVVSKIRLYRSQGSAGSSSCDFTTPPVLRAGPDWMVHFYVFGSNPQRPRCLSRLNVRNPKSPSPGSCMFRKY